MTAARVALTQDLNSLIAEQSIYDPQHDGEVATRRKRPRNCWHRTKAATTPGSTGFCWPTPATRRNWGFKMA